MALYSTVNYHLHCSNLRLLLRQQVTVLIATGMYLLFRTSYVEIEKQMAGLMYSFHPVLFRVTYFEITSHSIIRDATIKFVNSSR